MGSLDTFGETKSRQPSVMAYVAIGTVIICGLMLLLPSARSAKITRAKKELADFYVGPKNIANYYRGYLVSPSDKPQTLTASEQAYVCVFAPSPSSPVTPQLSMNLNEGYSTYSGEIVKNVFLLAPDPTDAKWTLYAKVWLAKTLNHDTKNPIPGDLAENLRAGSNGALKQLKSCWGRFSPEICRQAEAKLKYNLEVVASTRGVFRYFQDGRGTNYEIGPTREIWSFSQAYEEAFPKNRSGI